MSTTEERTPAATTSGSEFLSELQRHNENFESNKDEVLSQERQKACDEASRELLTSDEARARFEGIARNAAQKRGSKGCQLRKWCMTDNLAFNENHYLLDLLNKGTLLEEMQAWLDETYGDNNFLIYYHKVRKTKNEFAVALSWDSENFESLKEIIKHNREHSNGDGDRDREGGDDRRGGDHGGRRYDNSRGFRNGGRGRFDGPPRGRVFRERRDDRDGDDRRDSRGGDDRSDRRGGDDRRGGYNRRSNFRPRRTDGERSS